MYIASIIAFALVLLAQTIYCKKRDDDIEALVRIMYVRLDEFGAKLGKIDPGVMSTDIFNGQSIYGRSMETFGKTQARLRSDVDKLAKAAGYEFKTLPSKPAVPEETVVVKSK